MYQYPIISQLTRKILEYLEHKHKCLFNKVSFSRFVNIDTQKNRKP